MDKDPYEVLGVPYGATNDQIKSAYRILAKKYHPDLNGGSATAEFRMKEINEAYTMLIKNKGNSRASAPGGQFYRQSQNAYGGYGGFGSNSSQQDAYNPFSSFEQFFRQSQQRQYSGDSSSTYFERDARFRSVEEAVKNQDYAKAQRLLQNIFDRPAQWFYWNARVNIGIGNRMAAIDNIKMAVQLAPDEQAFRTLYVELLESGKQYRQQRTQFGFGRAICSNPCVSCVAVNLFFNCCCNQQCGCCC